MCASAFQLPSCTHTHYSFLIPSDRQMILLLFLSVVILLLLYVKLAYFTLRGPVPGWSPHLIFGNLIQSGILFGGKPSSEVYISFHKRFGDIYQYWVGFIRFIVVHDIDDVQYILTRRNIYDQGEIFLEKFSIIVPESIICNIGAKFKRHGAITLPLFRRSKIISNISIIIDSTDKLLDRWRARPSGYVHTDVLEQCQNLLLDMFGSIAFDYNLATLDNHNTDNKNELTTALQDIMSIFRMVIYAPNIVSTTYLKCSPKYQRARAIVERYLSNMVEQELGETVDSRAQRKKTSLIASLVSSLQTDEKMEAERQKKRKKLIEQIHSCTSNILLLAGLSRKELFDEMLMFTIAGYETTSTALAWCMHQLSKHPRVQQKIKTELMHDNNGQYLSSDRLDSLVYLDCFINEVLRYSPTIDGTSRTLTVDDNLPKSGTRLYKGDQVLIPTSALARDSRHWKIDPDLFYPERFLEEDKSHNPYAFLPFGGGHRQCLGQDLARLELKVILAHLLQQVTLGDGGPKVNAGGCVQKLTIMPKHVGIITDFH